MQNASFEEQNDELTWRFGTKSQMTIILMSVYSRLQRQKVTLATLSISTITAIVSTFLKTDLGFKLLIHFYARET